MCGIAGVLSGPSGERADESELLAMAAMLHHRGPDGHGLYLGSRLGLASTRLSIVDIEGGFQPLCDERQDVWVVHNGEIFNHVELREALIRRGHRFATSSDSEVIAHSYEELGPEAWATFNGQFAIALWDRRSSELWLVRDPLGIHPLFHAESGGSVVFASEAKALFAGGRINPAPDPQGLLDTVIRWSPSAPATVFAGVRQVRPGTALRIDASLSVTEHRYWSMRFPDATDPTTRDLGRATDGDGLDDAAEALAEKLRTAVTLRLRADVPVGAYLSGGLDSSYLAALVRAVHGGRLDTFGIGFEDPSFDETDAQMRMAARLGTRHHQIRVTAEQIQDALGDVVWHAEQPLMRTAPIPMYLLSRLVSDQGFKVALTGEGADEWFAGYSLFKEDSVRRFWARSPASALRPALLGRIHPEIGRDRARRSPFWQSFFGVGLDQPQHPLFSHLPRWQNAAWATRILSPEILAGGSVDASYAAVEASMPAGWQRWSPLARAQAIEVETFMSAYLLAAQGDRVGLAHGVELRYPFLDPNVIKLAMAMPDRYRLQGLRDKVVLRRAASKVLPPEIWDRPKQPFRAPVSGALSRRTPDGYIESLMSNGTVRRLGLLDPEVARRLMARGGPTGGQMPGEREEMALVGAITIQAWGIRFLEGLDRDIEEAERRLHGIPPRVLVRQPGQDAVAGGTAR